jgi:hypothetical protein
MSYENTHCPCGGEKARETMICPECEAAVAGTYDRKRMDDPLATWEQRRRSAILVLAVSRQRRKADLPLAYRAA